MYKKDKLSTGAKLFTKKNYKSTNSQSNRREEGQTAKYRESLEYKNSIENC